MAQQAADRTNGPQSSKAVNSSQAINLSQAVKSFIQSLGSGGPGLETLPVQDARKFLVKAQVSVKVDLSGIDESEKTITTDGFTLKLNIVRPEGITKKLPGFIFIHGGGWVLGDYPTHRRLVRDLVVASGYAAVFVNYTPTPDARYPRAINEIYAATKWVAEHGAGIDVDGGKLAIVGNSAGGNMAAVICLMAKDRGGPEIRLQILMWPVTDSTFSQASYEVYGELPTLSTPMMKWLWDLYTTDPKERKEYYASPLQAGLDELKGLPPALIQVAENDILRDEAEAYGRKLDEAGVTVTTVRYDGVVHDWGMLNELAEIPQTEALIMLSAGELKKYLG
jgi:acetyl esterase